MALWKHDLQKLLLYNILWCSINTFITANAKTKQHNKMYGKQNSMEKRT
jgi:hypothetical protein